MSEWNPDELDLFPAPQSTTASAAEAPAGFAAPVSVVHDSSLNRQGYRITAVNGSIELCHADGAGLGYGLDTVRQLRETGALDRSALRIDDWPDFATRGYMLDISRGRVPTRSSLRRLVGVLSTARYNQLELYTEHTFAYAGHAEVWESSSPITPDDVRWLDALCEASGIARVANQNCLGHMERWLAHPRYLDRAESAEGVNLVSEVLPPTTLAPTPENVAFVSGLLEELVPLFRHRRINIGCDEPWELGQGASRERAETDGLGRVYTDYVGAVMAPWIKRGYQVEYWADVAGHHPEALDSMPAGSIPIVWMYNSPTMMQNLVAQDDRQEEAGHAAHGIVIRDLTEGFRDRGRAFIDAGIPFWVAPGTNAWRSVTGRLDEAMLNLVDAAEVGLENGGDGYLVTSWGNQGHWDPPIVSVPPIIAGGAFSWALATNRSIDLPGVLSRRVFDDASGVLARVLCDVGRIPELLETPVLNTSPLWVLLQSGGRLPAKHTPPPAAVRRVRELLIESTMRLGLAQPACASGDIEVADLQFVIVTALLAVDLIAAGLGAETNPTPIEARAGLDRLEQILAQHAQRWTATSRYGGLVASLAELEPLRARLQRIASGITDKTDKKD
ncbi:family 20 glycosylhydrolase [Rathayibacter soli]|uniref:family 20 glycosylhydrolase n=1 Tax=Rathayibacter soli TaxID=3144168 RepID=UPI0027E5AE4F|nr:family 20 glycosylhydrolase [Glaciibacter superstes]